nr:hypothetical protein [Candidatus Sigynarchaeota archaeon]
MPKHSLKPVKASQKELNKIAPVKGAIRTGRTLDPQTRAKQYEKEGYGGTMFFADTTNMKKAENKLLGNDLRHNTQEKSNAHDEPGKIYVIKVHMAPCLCTIHLYCEC